MGATALALCKQLRLYPVAGSGLGGDGFYLDVTGERFPIVGGTWASGAISGVFALYLSTARSIVSSNIGARPAYVL